MTDHLPDYDWLDTFLTTNILLMRLFTSHFHTSAALLALKNHRLFSKVEWERIEAGQYAVVDPVNPGVILYLSEQDYIVMVRVAITSNRTLKVLAGPADLSADSSSSDSSTSSSQNSPKDLANRSVPFAGKVPMSSTARRRLQTMFSSVLDKFLHKERKGSGPDTKFEKTSMIKLTVRNARHWFITWYNLVSWYSRGFHYHHCRYDRKKFFRTPCGPNTEE